MKKIKRVTFLDWYLGKYKLFSFNFVFWTNFLIEQRSVSVSMIRLLVPRYRTCGARLSVKEGKYELPFSQEPSMSFSFSANKMKNGRKKKEEEKERKLYVILSKLSESPLSGTPLSFLSWLSLHWASFVKEQYVTQN